MRHFQAITKTSTKPANEVQDALCLVANAVAAVLGALGGSSPIVSFIDGKCAFETPNDQ